MKILLKMLLTCSLLFLLASNLSNPDEGTKVSHMKIDDTTLIQLLNNEEPRPK